MASTDISNAQLIRAVNERLEATIAKMREVPARELRLVQRGVSEPPLTSIRELFSITLLSKLACFAGLTYGVMRYFGYGLGDLRFITRGCLTRTVRSLEDRTNGLQEHMTKRFQDLSDAVAAYKAELRETEADATAAAGQVRRNMEAVTAQVQAVNKATATLDAKTGRTHESVWKLCSLVADTFPNSAAQHGLRAVARDALPAPPPGAPALPPIAPPPPHTQTARLPGRLPGYHSGYASRSFRDTASLRSSSPDVPLGSPVPAAGGAAAPPASSPITIPSPDEDDHVAGTPSPPSPA